MTPTTERITAQLSTCANELRILAVMLGPENNIGIEAMKTARWLEDKRERWSD